MAVLFASSESISTRLVQFVLGASRYTSSSAVGWQEGENTITFTTIGSHYTYATTVFEADNPHNSTGYVFLLSFGL